MDVESADVDGEGYEADEASADDELGEQLRTLDASVGEALPEVAEKDEAAQPAGVDGQVFDAKMKTELSTCQPGNRRNIKKVLRKGASHAEGGDADPRPPHAAERP